MVTRNQRRLWKNWRTHFRRLRMSCWVTLIVVLGALLYLNEIGLPDFVKEPILEKLRARGLDLQFTRLRWRWYRGLVAENVLIGRTDDPLSPKLTARQVAVGLDHLALAKFQFQVDSLTLREGQLAWPVATTNAEPLELSADNIQTQLQLLPNDVWRLERFRARFAGADFLLTATITNASEVRNWKIFHPSGMPGGLLQERLRRIADRLNHLHFNSPPLLIADAHGDARNRQSLALEANVNAPDADTPWGTFEHCLLSAQLAPATSNGLSLAEFRLQAASVRTPWAATTNLSLMLLLAASAQDTNVIHASIDLGAGTVATRWGEAVDARLMAQWLQRFTNPIPLAGDGEVQMAHAKTTWGDAKNFQFSTSLSPTKGPASLDASWGWWTNLAFSSLNWECRVAGLQSPKLKTDELFCGGQWLAPELQATQIVAHLYGGSLDARARLDVATRRFGFSGSSGIDAQGISDLLTPKAQQWLSQFSWKTLPQLQAEGALILPAWTNRSPDWRAEMRPTVSVLGHFRILDGAFRGVPVLTLDSHFSYSNEIWRLPDLTATRPEGLLDLFHESNDRTKDYYFRVHSTIDIRALRPLLSGARAQRDLDLLDFMRPPLVDAEVWGRWQDPDRIGMKGNVMMTNFTFRGESADNFRAALEYTNKALKLIAPRLQRGRGTQQMTAASMVVDFTTQKIYVTDGFSTAEPQVVARAIGPRIAEIFAPYRFPQPPVAHVQGTIPLHDETDADLHFDVRAGQFEWWKFKVPRFTARIDWVKDRLLLTNVQAEFYRGNGIGNAEFIFPAGQPMEFNFDAIVTNADLPMLMADIVAKTNQLEGRLDARVRVLQAKSQDWKSWQGRGRLYLHDGLIWDIPLFGILSPVLDGIAPGLGSSRASDASATYIITNGVITTDDLEIHASMMRLQYRGTIDLKGRVNARAQAELLRDTWAIGRLLSITLWPVSKLFEYKISGTVQKPRSEPVFLVPKIMLLPFRVLHPGKEPAPEPPKPAQTNAPSISP